MNDYLEPIEMMILTTRVLTNNFSPIYGEKQMKFELLRFLKSDKYYRQLVSKHALVFRSVNINKLRKLNKSNTTLLDIYDRKNSVDVITDVLSTYYVPGKDINRSDYLKESYDKIELAIHENEIEHNLDIDRFIYGKDFLLEIFVVEDLKFITLMTECSNDVIIELSHYNNIKYTVPMIKHRNGDKNYRCIITFIDTDICLNKDMYDLKRTKEIIEYISEKTKIQQYNNLRNQIK